MTDNPEDELAALKRKIATAHLAIESLVYWHQRAEREGNVVFKQFGAIKARNEALKLIGGDASTA